MRRLVTLLVFCSLLGISCQKSPDVDPTPGVTPAPQVSSSPDPAAVETPGFVPIAREEAPLSLTTADGTGQKLISVSAQAVIDGPLAFTQLHLVFENPEDRVVEGRFEITMPDGAAISRFAMKIDDQWQEAEVVERKTAQRIYEDFLHRKQDPALLEKEAGNEFHARIFPIPAKGRKDIMISYSQELASSSTPYLLPLAGLPKMKTLQIAITSEGKALPVVSEKDFQPHGDYAVPQDQAVAGLTGGNLVVARVRPTVSSTVAPLEDLLVLFDTSASRGLGFTDQVEQLADLLKELPTVKTLTVAAFDQTVETVYEGDPSKFSSQALLKRKALGATDLKAALAWAAKTKAHTRLLIVTDGITTAGDEKLGDSLKGSTLQRADVILVGGIRDKDRMQSFVSEALEQQGVVLEAELSPRQLARKLALSVNSGIGVAIEGATWVWPTTLNGVQPGDERLVYAELGNPAGTVAIALAKSKAVNLTLRSTDTIPLLTRSAATARIARLEAVRSETDDVKAKEKLAEEIVMLSTTHRVLSDHTALLVLETEGDYDRYGIDRKALADILEIGPKGLVLTDRPKLPTWAKTKSPVPREPRRFAEDGAARPRPASRREAPAPAASSSSSGDYVHEMESANYTVAQNRTESFENHDSFVGTLGGATAEPNLPGYQGVDGLVERRSAAPAEEIDPGAEFSAYRSQPVDNAGLVSSRRVRAQSSTGSGTPADGSDLPGSQSRQGPLDGKMAENDKLLKAGKIDQALQEAWAWRQAEPGNVLPLLALGDCLEANKDTATAARVYGSIIDLFPSRADLRRYAGSRLQSLKEGLPLAVDSFTKTVKQRPDHVSSHRFLAFGLAREVRYRDAFEALEKGLSQNYPGGRFDGWQRVLREDLRLVASAWIAQEPGQREAVVERLVKRQLTPADQPSLRFILTWETDANDVDFHIEDVKGGHAFYGARELPSGGELYADVTTGYGPECFAIEGKPQAFPYKLQIHYYARGPMGYGMGTLEVLQHDGKGHLTFEDRPYVVMQDGAYVDLGQVKGP